MPRSRSATGNASKTPTHFPRHPQAILHEEAESPRKLLHVGSLTTEISIPSCGDHPNACFYDSRYMHGSCHARHLSGWIGGPPWQPRYLFSPTHEVNTGEISGEMFFPLTALCRLHHGGGLRRTGRRSAGYALTCHKNHSTRHLDHPTAEIDYFHHSALQQVTF